MLHKPMTPTEALDYIASRPGISLTPTDLARILGGAPYAYNIQAKEGRLPFSHFFRGNRLYVSKAAIIQYVKGETP